MTPVKNWSCSVRVMQDMMDQNWRPRTRTIVTVLVLWPVHGRVYSGRQRVEDSQTAHFLWQTYLD